MKERVARLWRLGDFAARAPLQQLEYGFRNTCDDFEFFEHLDGIGECSWVGSRGSGADHVQRIPDHVGEQKAHHRCRVGERREAAAFEKREMLANRVQLKDIGAGAQEKIRCFLLGGERDGLGWRT